MDINVLIIAFCYRGSKDEIPGVDIDVKSIIKYAKEHLRVADNKIKIITDVEVDNKEHILLYDKTIDDNKLLHVLISYITSLTTGKLLMYYTGHGTVQDIDGKRFQNMLLPHTPLATLNENDLYRVFMRSSPKLEVFTIIDACHGGFMQLKYALEEGWVCNKCCLTEDIPCKMICITSSSDRQQSGVTTNGSLFTNILLQYLKENNNGNLLYLRNSIRESMRRYHQLPNIMCNGSMEQNIYDWIIPQIVHICFR